MSTDSLNSSWRPTWTYRISESALVFCFKSKVNLPLSFTVETDQKFCVHHDVNVQFKDIPRKQQLGEERVITVIMWVYMAL